MVPEIDYGQNQGNHIPSEQQGQLTPTGYYHEWCQPPHNNHPVYLGITLDRSLNRSLTYMQHLETLQKKVTTRNGLLRCWQTPARGAQTSTLHTGAVALVYRAAEHALPIWCHSSHTKTLNATLNKQHNVPHHWIYATSRDDFPPSTSWNHST